MRTDEKRSPEAAPNPSRHPFEKEVEYNEDRNPVISNVPDPFGRRLCT
jgi:hypothetical protein